MKPVGKPDAGNPHVRFDERGRETEPRQAGLRGRRESVGNTHRKANATAPVLDSTEGAVCWGGSSDLGALAGGAAVR
jgi:hypothetical protein